MNAEQKEYLKNQMIRRKDDLLGGMRYYKAWTLKLTPEELSGSIAANKAELAMVDSTLKELCQ